MRVHAPTDIALVGLKTRNMYRKRAGRPRSEMSRSGDTSAPVAATQRAAIVVPVSVPVIDDTNAMTAEMPATPPTKK